MEKNRGKLEGNRGKWREMEENRSLTTERLEKKEDFVPAVSLYKSSFFNRKSGFFNWKSEFLNRKSGFFH